MKVLTSSASRANVALINETMPRSPIYGHRFMYHVQMSARGRKDASACVRASGRAKGVAMTSLWFGRVRHVLGDGDSAGCTRFLQVGRTVELHAMLLTPIFPLLAVFFGLFHSKRLVVYFSYRRDYR